MKKFWKELKQRWISESPKFWSRVKRIAVSIGTAALAIILAERQWILGIDPQIISICGYIVAVCAGMGLSAQLTTNKTPTDEKTNDRA